MAGGCGFSLTIDVAAYAGTDLEAILAAALKATPVTSVVIYGAGLGDRTATRLKPLVEAVQRSGAAAMIGDDPGLARILKADGVHLTWSKSVEAVYRDAREALGARFIVGADAGKSRHDAMTLGELGADYVAFGAPAHVDDRAKAEERQLDLIAWWGEIFEPPCVAFDVGDPARARALAEAGADFIASPLPLEGSPATVTSWSRAFAEAIAAPEKAA